MIIPVSLVTITEVCFNLSTSICFSYAEMNVCVCVCVCVCYSQRDVIIHITRNFTGAKFCGVASRPCKKKNLCHSNY